MDHARLPVATKGRQSQTISDFWRVLRILYCCLITVTALPFIGYWPTTLAKIATGVVWAVVVTIWIVTLVTLKNGRAALRLTAYLQGLRRRAGLFWCIIVAIGGMGVIGWELVGRFQICGFLSDIAEVTPILGRCNSSNGLISSYQLLGMGRMLSAMGMFYLLSFLWLIISLMFYGVSSSESREIVQQLKVMKPAAVGILLSLSTIIVCLAVAELGLRYLLVQSQGNGTSPFQQNWLKHYWVPINSLGYRDFAIQADLPVGSKRILVLGDSLAAGWGVARIEDTFPHVLNQKLGPTYAVNIVAQPGWDTMQEFQALKTYPVKPNIIILSYDLNDIEGLAAEATSPSVISARQEYRSKRSPTPNTLAGFFIYNFYVPAYLYFNAFAPSSGDAYMNFLLASYQDKGTWDAQKNVLQELINWAKDNGAQIVVLIWPEEIDYGKSDQITGMLEQFLAANNTTTINMKHYMLNLTASQLYASPFDRHPNAFRHRIAADQLYAALNTLNN